jgi:hypothetical protein
LVTVLPAVGVLLAIGGVTTAIGLVRAQRIVSP